MPSHSATEISATPSILSLLISDLQPETDRWKFAARIALSGLIIIAVQMTLRLEILYPAMSTMLIVSEMKGAGTVTRFLLNVVATTIGCAAAVALGAMFIQQPWFLLPLMWAYITFILYLMGASAYRSAIFMAGYPFIVINFMMFFDKGHAEHIAIIVYKSALVGLCSVSLVTIFLWPIKPLHTLKESMLTGFRRSQQLLRRMIAQIRQGTGFNVSTLIPDYYRTDTASDIEVVDRAQVDYSLCADDNRDLISLLAYERRCSVTFSMQAQRLAANSGESSAKLLDNLLLFQGALDNVIDQLEKPSETLQTNAAEMPTQAAAHNTEPTDEVFSLRTLLPIYNLLQQAPQCLKSVRTLKRLQHEVDFGSQVLLNLRTCLGNIFRQKLNPINATAMKHGIKCASAIMICALVCITLNWNMGIGCVETVMLVVQLTFGGTLMIGALRFTGVLIGFTLAVLAIIFIMPIVTTLSGFLLIFAPVLFCAGYGMHGSPRVSTPSLQVMIVFDFALLQLFGPDISLLPVMNFALAVVMGIGVTFAIYRFVWPVRSTDMLQPCLAEILELLAELLKVGVQSGASIAAVQQTHLKIDGLITKYMTLQHTAQYESAVTITQVDIRVRALEATENFTLKVMDFFGGKFLGDAISPELAPLILVAIENIQRCRSMLLCQGDGELLPSPIVDFKKFPLAECFDGLDNHMVGMREAFMQLNAIPIAEMPTLQPQLPPNAALGLTTR